MGPALRNGSLYALWVSPKRSGASYGCVAAGGPGFTSNRDTAGGDWGIVRIGSVGGTFKRRPTRPEFVGATPAPSCGAARLGGHAPGPRPLRISFRVATAHWVRGSPGLKNNSFSKSRTAAR